MKVTTFSKIGVTVGAVCLVVGALAVPATADPAPATYGHLVGFGSDTTQDVVNGLAAAIGGNALASYDAFGSSTVVTREGGIAVPRTSGSGAGRDQLRVAIGQTASATVAVAPTGTASATGANSLGQIDFARSSSGPSTATGDGVLTYVPFARDAVSVAVDPDSPLAVVPFVVGNSDTAGSTTPSLYNIYRGSVKFAYVSGTAGNYAYVGVGATNAAPAGSAAYAIQPLLPKAGSGTRSFFIGKIALSETNITALPAGTIKSTFNNGVDVVDVQEHDGSAIDGDLTAIAPFSIAQWVAQANDVDGVVDRRHGVVMLGLNGTSATTGTSTFATNPAFTAMTRDVYNIVPSKLADDATSAIAKTFVGASSLVCSAQSTITAYGFQLMPGTSLDSTCGYKGLRAYDASTSSISVAFDQTTIAANESFSAQVTVNPGNHSQGGTVYIVDANDEVIGEGIVEAGSTTATVEATPTAIGALSATAEFVPNLSGIKSSVSAPTELTVVAAPTVSSISVPSAIKLGTTVPVIAWIDGADAAGGTVTLRDGETVLATKALTAGEQGAYLTFVAKKIDYSLTASYTAPAGSTTANSASAVKAISLAKGTPTVKPSAIASVKANKTAKFTVQIVGIAGVVPTGTVTIKEGTKTLVSAKVISSSTGKVSITLPKLKKGSHKLTVTYNGDAKWNAAAKSAVVKIK